MLNLLKKIKSAQKLSNNPNQKILITFVALSIFRFGNSIPLTNIDQDALRKALLQMDNRNPIMQLVNMYSEVGGKNTLTVFSLGIVPFINASIFIDLLTAIFPYLEKLQSEEGEMGRKKLTFYKKILTFFFSLIQSSFLIFYLKPYIYNTSFFNLALIVIQLVVGALMIVWLTTYIDNKGIGNGTSLFIFTNILTNLAKINLNVSSNSFYGTEIIFLLFIFTLILISQITRFNINVVSARQLAFLENLETQNLALSNYGPASRRVSNGGLSIKLNQAGIFPIIIASNLVPFISYFSLNLMKESKLVETTLYYICIILFNYFYTVVFWDPEKISEQLRKASVSLEDVKPGQTTTSYLSFAVLQTSIAGGFFLCFILLTYEIVKQNLNSPLLNQLNVSSFIILVGIGYEIQRTISALYKNV